MKTKFFIALIAPLILLRKALLIQRLFNSSLEDNKKLQSKQINKKRRKLK